VKDTRTKRILVTGGAGFIGSHLCDRLVAAGHEVICCDNYVTGSEQNIQHLQAHCNFTMLQQDIRELKPSFGVDEIYHLACIASPVHYQCSPIDTIMTSVAGMYNVLEFAKQCGAKVLQTSTSEVYGDPAIHPQPETYCGNVNPIGLRACYDEGKRTAESLCMDYHRKHKVQVHIARIFNTYGSRMSPDDGRAIPAFIRQASENQPITLYGSGSQTRSFCYVDDTVDALMLLMNSEYAYPVNIGNPEEHTIRQLAETIIGMVGNHVPLLEYPATADDPKRRCPDISLARKILNWSPTISLNEGLRKTLEQRRQNTADK
jgi:UDP-glucuronate decarboxylase